MPTKKLLSRPTKDVIWVALHDAIDYNLSFMEALKHCRDEYQIAYDRAEQNVKDFKILLSRKPYGEKKDAL